MMSVWWMEIIETKKTRIRHNDESFIVINVRFEWILKWWMKMPFDIWIGLALRFLSDAN